MAISIERAEARMFEFTIGDSPEVHRMPLAAYMPYGFVMRTMGGKASSRFAFEMLREFCPELEDDPDLNLETVTAIFDAWNDASRRDGADAGK